MDSPSTPLSRCEFKAGVLNYAELGSLFAQGAIATTGNPPELKQKDSAFDLHLGRCCYEMPGVMKLGPGLGIRTDLIDRCRVNVLDLANPQVLKQQTTYLIELQESLNLQRYPEIFGYATGKSSIGRLDVLTHLMVDDESRYDYVHGRGDDGFVGNLYVQVTPLTFPIKVQNGCALNQLRLFCERPELSELTQEVRVRHGNLLMKDRNSPASRQVRDGQLSLAITPDPKEGCVAFAARTDRPFTDSDAIALYGNKRAYHAEDYWEKILPQEPLLVQPNRLYILRSLERLQLPGDIAVTCIAMTEDLGEARVHYAGFAHPWFGSSRHDAEQGTPLIFEVRCYTKQALNHREVFAAVKFYRMSEPAGKPPIEDAGPFESQCLTLSDYFAEWQQ